MADLKFPWEAFMQAQAQKRKNQEDMMNLFGSTLSNLGQVGGQALQKRGQQRAQQAFGQQLTNATSPAQGPATQGGQGPTQPPVDVGKLYGLAGRAFPGQEGSIMPGIMEMFKPKKPQMEWSPVSGMISKSGQPLEIDKTTGEIKTVNVPGGVKSTGYGSMMGPIRQAQYTIQDLPSNQGPSTAGGAAYQVKVAARQGKSLIAKATNPQAISLASADLGRAVQRSAPLAETIGASNFADNLTTKWNQLTQLLTSDPKSKDIPKIRKEIYNMFDELDKSATPFISNQLDDMEENGFKVSPNIRKRQLGETLPDIPFIDISGAGSTIKNPNDLSNMSDEELRKIISGGK